MKKVILIIGKPDYGKSTTINKLFGHTVRTSKGQKKLNFIDSRGESYEERAVATINGSFEESGRDILDYQTTFANSNLIICNVQHTNNGRKTIEFFKTQGYEIKAFWLKIGFNNQIDTDAFLFDDLISNVTSVDVSKGVDDLVDKIKSDLTH